MTYCEILSYGKELLKTSGESDYESDAWLLFSYCTAMNRTKYMLSMRTEADDCIMQAYDALLQKRINHMPVQYILGTQSFMGLNFFVNENVLIPRADTEVLVEETLRLIPDAGKVLDMCTGSACIAVSIKYMRPEVQVMAVDISEAALEISKLNAWYNETDINFCCSDLFENVSEKFDLIVSNPPYIESEEIEKLENQVKDFEPRLALDGGVSGLDIYERLLTKAGKYLNNNGYIALEIGCFQAEAVSKIVAENGFTDIKVVKDLAGLDRVVTARKIKEI